MNEVQSLGFISSKLKFIYFKNVIEIWLTDNVVLKYTMWWYNKSVDYPVITMISVAAIGHYTMLLQLLLATFPPQFIIDS